MLKNKGLKGGNRNTVKVTAFATIKLNSQRVPQKNIRRIGSKPLCYHSLATALQVPEIDDVIVYCSDDIIKEYIPEKVEFLRREKWLDGDEIRAKDTYSEFIKEVDSDIYVALLTTAPFIKPKTLENALKKVISGEYDSAFCVKRLQTFAWYKGEPLNYDPQDVPRTQDIEPVLAETSGFFIFSKELWINEGRRIGFAPFIQELDDIEGIDIDTPLDFELASVIAEHMLHI